MDREEVIESKGGGCSYLPRIYAYVQKYYPSIEFVGWLNRKVIMCYKQDPM